MLFKAILCILQLQKVTHFQDSMSRGHGSVEHSTVDQKVLNLRPLSTNQVSVHKRKAYGQRGSKKLKQVGPTFTSSRTAEEEIRYFTSEGKINHLEDEGSLTICGVLR